MKNIMVLKDMSLLALMASLQARPLPQLMLMNEMLLKK